MLLGDVEERAAASLARMAPGVRGVVLFTVARGDDRYAVAGMLGITGAAVDAILTEGDGQHLTRPDG